MERRSIVVIDLLVRLCMCVCSRYADRYRYFRYIAVVLCSCPAMYHRDSGPLPSSPPLRMAARTVQSRTRWTRRRAPRRREHQMSAGGGQGEHCAEYETRLMRFPLSTVGASSPEIPPSARVGPGWNGSDMRRNLHAHAPTTSSIYLYLSIYILCLSTL